MIRVYCAGKSAKNDWRHELFPGLSDAFYGDGYDDGSGAFTTRGMRVRPRGEFEYAGPFFVAAHGGRHGENQHGAAPIGDHGIIGQRDEVLGACLSGIASCDAFFVWFDDLTAYGTMAEIGYAKALGKPIWHFEPSSYGREGVCISGMELAGRFEDAWFPRFMADRSFIADDPVGAFEEFERSALPFFRVKLLRELPYSEYLQTVHWKALRADALQRAEYRCQVCNGTETLTVHHRTYDRLGEELASDLTVLCRPCHARHHASDRTAARPPKGAGR